MLKAKIREIREIRVLKYIRVIRVIRVQKYYWCAKNIRVIREIRVQKSRVQKIIIRVQNNLFVFKIQNSNHGSPRCSTTILTCCANRYFACFL